MQKKNIFLWTLYDFANSIVIGVFFIYFTQWLVVENKVSDFWYNMVFVGATVLLIGTSPILGSISDQIKNRMKFLRPVTVLMFMTGLTCAWAAAFGFGSHTVIVAILAYLACLYFYQLQFTFYNPLLEQIAPPEKRGFISGLGQSANWLGQIAGLLITLPLATGAIYLFGHPGRAQTLIPAVILFLLFSLPMLLFFKETNGAPQTPTNGLSLQNIKHHYGEYWFKLKSFLKVPGIARYLLGFFLFNDAIITAQNNFPIYLEQVFRVSDKTKVFLMLAILSTAAIGALFGGWFADKIGHKKSLMVILVTWTILFPLLGAMANFSIFCGLAIFMGMLYGATWTVTRAVMLDLSPKDNLNHAFSYYSLAERFSSFAGPLVWGLINVLFINLGANRYRVAIFSMSLFIILGIIVIKKLSILPEGKQSYTI